MSHIIVQTLKFEHAAVVLVRHHSSGPTGAGLLELRLEGLVMGSADPSSSDTAAARSLLATTEPDVAEQLLTARIPPLTDQIQISLIGSAQTDVTIGVDLFPRKD